MEEAEAKKLVTNPRKVISDLKPGTLFRVESTWYRLLSTSKKMARLQAIAGPDTELPADTEVTEISVLSKP